MVTWASGVWGAGKAIAKAGAKKIGKAIADGVSDAWKSVKGWFKKPEPAPKGARTAPADLQEQLSMEEAIAGGGEPYKGKLGDPKYHPETGTVNKREHSHAHPDGTKTEVHWDVDRETGKVVGKPKIKDDTNAKSRGHRYPQLKRDE